MCKRNVFFERIDGVLITLPPALDEEEIGEHYSLPLTLANDVLSNLTRKHSYIGKAWYQKEVEISEDGLSEIIELTLEQIILTTRKC